MSRETPIQIAARKQKYKIFPSTESERKTKRSVISAMVGGSGGIT